MTGLVTAASSGASNGQRLLVMAGLLALVVLGWLLMWRGWRRRGARQADLPALPPLPQEPGRQLLPEPVTAVYVGTTTSGRWLDRIVARGLGAPADAVVNVTAKGVVIARGIGQEPVWIPAETLRGWAWAHGLAGRVVPGESVLVLTWEHGGLTLDTGLFPRLGADRAALAEAVGRLAPSGSTDSTDNAGSPS